MRGGKLVAKPPRHLLPVVTRRLGAVGGGRLRRRRLRPSGSPPALELMPWRAFALLELLQFLLAGSDGKGKYFSERSSH